MTNRDLVKATLEFRNTTGQIPRDLWVLPCAIERYPDEFNAIVRDFPGHFDCPMTVCSRPPMTVGDPFAVGEYTDEWGCTFQNINRGVIGEVKAPIVPAADEEWEDLSRVHIPEELLSFDVETVNASCRASDRFMLSGCCPRPFEQLQFIRGTEQLYMDLITRPKGMMDFIERMHDFYCRLLTKWAETEVDCLRMMDDWGAQQQLLINPRIWREIFKPMYRDYIDIAHKHGKKMFMHSDGHTLAILPDLVELGLDAINCQIFCMGVEKLAPFRGQITFWGEIDRQHLLPYGTVEDIKRAVASVREYLWQDGGCIAQCEFGPGAKPENVRAVYEAWAEM